MIFYFLHTASLQPVAETRPTRQHLTVAKTPKLTTKLRTRKVHILSQAEREELEIEELKKYVYCNCLHFVR